MKIDLPADWKCSVPGSGRPDVVTFESEFVERPEAPKKVIVVDGICNFEVDFKELNVSER